MNIAEAARDASTGANDALWLACHDAAIEGGYYDEFKTDNRAMCERAIRSMSKEQRALYFEETI